MNTAPNLKEECHSCAGQRNRLLLAEALSAARAAGQEAPDRYGDLRQQDAYTVTGMAANLVPGRIWVRAGDSWRWHHAEHEPEPGQVRELRLNDDGEAEMGEEAYSLLAGRWGEGHRDTMPEEVACWLGIDHGVDPIYAQCLAGDYANRNMDTLTFSQAARELRTQPELLGQCTCPKDGAPDGKEE